MSNVAPPQLAQDLRLLDLLQAHPELTEPEGVKLRERLVTLCEAQGESAHPVRIAETVVDYLKETPSSSVPVGVPVPWKRPATKAEWEAALATIHAGYEAKKKLDGLKFKSALTAILGSAVLGGLLSWLTGEGFLGVIGLMASLCLYCSFIPKRLGPAQRVLIQKKNETIQKWTIEQTENRIAVKIPDWAKNTPGWELTEREITPTGMRDYRKSPRALEAYKALHRGEVPLLAADFQHIRRLAEEDQREQDRIRDEDTRREWAILLAQ